LSTHDDLSPDVQALLKDLHEEFEQLHLDAGHATRILFLDHIRTPSMGWDLEGWKEAAFRARSADHEACLDRVLEWCPDDKLYFRLTRLEVECCTPSFALRTYLDVYFEMVATGVRRIFANLIKIGYAVAPDGVAWAKEQASILIRHYRYLVVEWVRKATASGDQESWRAQRFLIIAHE
jgi:hypothetical protein